MNYSESLRYLADLVEKEEVNSRSVAICIREAAEKIDYLAELLEHITIVNNVEETV